MLELLTISFVLLVVLPIAVYLAVKFAWTGYYRAKRREQEKDKNKL